MLFVMTYIKNSTSRISWLPILTRYNPALFLSSICSHPLRRAKHGPVFRAKLIAVGVSLINTPRIEIGEPTTREMLATGLFLVGFFFLMVVVGRRKRIECWPGSSGLGLDR